MVINRIYLTLFSLSLSVHLNEHKQNNISVCESRESVAEAVLFVSHQSLGYHHRNSHGSPLMHSKLFVDGKFQAGRQGSLWWGQARFGLSAERERASQWDVHFTGGKYIVHTVKYCTNSVQVLTVTPKYPARRRAPMMINREPIKKRTVARAMALYGTLGGLLLNCNGGEIFH